MRVEEKSSRLWYLGRVSATSWPAPEDAGNGYRAPCRLSIVPLSGLDEDILEVCC